ncbi:hypothetical protein BDC45DRAFT_571552 [Circinella umbellata]|nr:hypothetical protein BDC45DRAFT_571552 [Circinella umbellata]
MSSSTTQKQPAATIIKEGSASLGKRKRQTTSKDDKEILRDLVKEVLQQNYQISSVPRLKSTTKKKWWALVSLGGTKQLWEQEQQPENDENEANSIGSDEDTLRMTSPVAIVSVLRDTISNDLVHNSLKQAAMDAITTVSNVSALVRMTFLLLAQQNISIIKRDEVQLEKEKSGFDITNILPKSFTIHNKEPLNSMNKIMVAHSNLTLKDQLDKLYKSNTRAKDLQDICTNVHLQFIQSHHLGNKKDNNNDIIHSLWTDLMFKKSNFSSRADGSSITTAAAIKEFNTNLQNMELIFLQNPNVS